ncbi:MAG: site-2 protease family protein [Cyclobacteriaceae bacterium]
MNKQNKTRIIQIGLFVLTLIVTTIAGAEWMTGRYLFFTEPAMSWQDFLNGFNYSIPFLLILTCHEFGHYLTAKYHKVKTTLPYYIPMWLGFIPTLSFGTMGAFIQIKDLIVSRKQFFDIGIAGPLAGFVIAIGVILYGYNNLPEPEQIFEVHPEYEQFGLDYAEHVYDHEFQVSQHYQMYLKARVADSLDYLTTNTNENDVWAYPEFEAFESYPNLSFNKPLLFQFIESFIEDKSRIPNEREIMHNPYLLAGLLALFFTALNLFPIGQLDGGHIVFGLLGTKNSEIVSKVLFSIFVFYAGLGLININELADVSIGASLNFLILILGYLYFLYVCAYSLFKSKQDRLTFAAVVLTLQFLLNYLFAWEGYSGWLLFSLVLGRFIGVKHPPVIDDTPLSLERKVLGWFALFIFVISFSPEPFIMDGF